MNNYYKAGSYNAICDVCGFKFKSDELKETWKGLRVDKLCYESRHPQSLIQVNPEDNSIPWSRPEGTDTFL